MQALSIVRSTVFLAISIAAGLGHPVLAKSTNSERGLLALEVGNTRAALRAFDAAFKAGDADAGFYLGRIVEQGLGVEVNLLHALALYKEAAKRGSPKALNRLGTLLAEGTIVDKDEAKARRFFCEAAGLGLVDGAYNCATLQWAGRGGTKQTARALAHYRRAAEANHIAANLLLGRWYRDGNTPLKRNAKLALTHFERAASFGNPVAQFELGRLFESGILLPKNLETAQLYYLLGAMRGHRAAQAAAQRLGAVLDGETQERAHMAARLWRARNTDTTKRVGG